MANPYGNLAGWSDRQDPNFKTNLKAAIDRPRRASRGGRRIRHLDATQPYFDLLWRATRQRGLPLVTYIRRAVAAFIAYDLGIPFENIVQYTPRPQVDAVSRESFKPTTDDGQGYGKWHIDTLN